MLDLPPLANAEGPLRELLEEWKGARGRGI